MGGEDGSRGYLVQTFVALLDSLESDGWSCVTIEPNANEEKVDILWEGKGWKKVSQVKSSRNQISMANARGWTAELKSNTFADEYELVLIGPCSETVAKINTLNGVRIPTPKPLDFDVMVGLASHRLEKFLFENQLPTGTAYQRETMVKALITDLFSTVSKPQIKSEFIGKIKCILRSFVSKADSSTANSNVLSLEGDCSQKAINRYRSFVEREWLSLWGDSSTDDNETFKPPFIEDQVIRKLDIRLKNSTPKTYLRVEYFRKVRSDESRRKSANSRVGPLSKRIRWNETTIHSEPQKPTKKRDVWQPISRDTMVSQLMRPSDGGKNSNRTVIATDAGIGKTTNLRWINYTINCGGKTHLALLVNVSELPENPNEFLSTTLVAAFRKAEGNDSTSLSQTHAESLLQELRTQGRLILLIDALDQIKINERACINTLKQVLADENWNMCHIVLGSRPFALERDWYLLFSDEMARGWSFLHIDEFKDEQQRKFLGEKLYAAIPPDAREVLSIPRVLYYLGVSLSISRDESTQKFRTASDVYWSAISSLLSEGMRATDAHNLHPNQARLLLSAIAFEMVSSGNFDEIKPHQIDDFVLAVSNRCKTFSVDSTVDWTFEKIKQIAAMNEFLSHGILEVGCPQQIRWRNRSLQEFFAAMWISKYITKSDSDILWEWVFLARKPQTGDYYWVWRFATEMPLEGRNPEAWINAMRHLYCPRESVVDCCKRSNEMIYRSWTLMTRFASGEDGTDYSKKMAVEILASFLQEFPRICDGAFGRAAKRVAEQLLSEFRLIPPDPIDKRILKFEMGSPESEFGRGRNESIVETQIKAQFKLTCYLVTQEQYALFDPDHVPWQQRRKSKRRRPVVNVNWYDAWVYCRWMGEKYRLPLENEWEFACRAGTRTAYSFGEIFRLTHMRSGIADPRGLIPVGCMQPNPWGLFDMHGLTWEWCDSWYADDPKNAFHSHFSSEYRVTKGGAANTSALRGRSAERAFRDPSDGSGLICFRILLEVEKK